MGWIKGSRWVGVTALSTLAGCYPYTPPALSPVTAPAPPAPPATARAMTMAAENATATILISIDGFRPDYLDRGITPNLSRLAAGGVRGAMRPSFPSKTFPNHWTIVTGLRPDRHGITANMMEDAQRPGEKFTMASDDPFWWNAAEPIWVTAEKAGIPTATMFWPGANVAWGGTRATAWPYETTGGTRPHDWQQYAEPVPERQRVDAIIDWLRRPAATRPRFLTLYFEAVDTIGHRFGPDAEQTNRAIEQVDATIGRLAAELATLRQEANLVIVSDHGMAATTSERTIPLDRIAPPALYRVVEAGPYATFIPAAGQTAAFEAAFLKPHPHMTCWRKGDMPARFHYGRNARIPPYLCLAEIGWTIAPTAPEKALTGGNHGYDNEATAMRALFVANGPAFRAGRKIDSFDIVDVAPLLRRLIGLPPATGVDGTDRVFRGILAPSRQGRD